MNFKQLLSYLMEVPVESVDSEFNESLHVTLKRGRYALNTPNAIYSYEDLYVNFYKAFEHLKIADRNIQDVLILGFGLGSIPVMLEKNFNCKFAYTGVEIDEAVIELANKYAINKLSSPVSVIQADAELFAEIAAEEGEHYDLICIDVFIDDQIPEGFLSEDFMQNCRSLLSQGGLLLFNHLARHAADECAARDYFRGVFTDIFPDADYLDTGGNWILIGKQP